MRTVLALIRATHPAPALVVTALATALGVVAGLAASTTVVLAVAVLAGQATIGWSNDLIDGDRDRLAGRTDKPLATGHVSRTVVRAALIVALPVVLAASAVLGLPAASAHLVLLVAGWSYNAGLKATAASPLPYAVAFGALPAIPYLALDPAVMPPWWMMVVGALLGVGAHVVNVLPDLADDAATGVRGFPHRLGVRASGVFAVVALLGGTTVGVLGPMGPVPWWAWAVLVLAAVLALLSVAAPRRLPFYGALAIAVLNVVTLLARPG